MKEISTVQELADHLWGDLPKYQREVNTAWVKNVFRLLKDGGTWTYIAAARTFKKLPNDKIVEI